MNGTAKNKSFLGKTAILLMRSLGLAVGLPMLVVSLFVCIVFGCSLCLVLAELVGHAMTDGFIGAELLSDLRVGFIAFMIASLMAWVSVKIVSFGPRRRSGLGQRRLA
jgi:hypothetical protein